MRLLPLPFLAVALFSVCSVAACGDGTASNDDALAAGESNYTSEGGAGDTSDAAAPVADVAPFVIADANSTKPKLRFSVDGAPAVDAYQPEWTTVISGAVHRFKLQGATPVQGGKPVFYVELGRGAAFIEKGTYDCAASEALVLIIDTDGAKKMTLVDGAPSRACKVVIDEAVDFEVTAGVRPRSARKVLGHVEATVGDRANGASPTKSIRATFAVSVIES